MKILPKSLAPALLAALITLPAAARNADGTLGFLRTPNNGVPALLAGTTNFEAEAAGEATLTLEGPAGTYPVAVTWGPAPGGRAAGSCTLPPNTPPGLYGLRAKHPGGEDLNTRAVAVLPPAEDLYAIAHLSDTHLGSGRHKRSSTDIMNDVIDAINTSGATFCLVTGDVTENGEMAQYADFLTALDRCTLPTFVVAGNHDRLDLNYEKVFGKLTYAFAYGRDGYLGFDSKDYNTAPDLGAQNGDLERLRRSIKAARWSIGFSHRYEDLQGMRSQLTLFVDNPLDVLLFGHWHVENTPDQRAVPWGRTRISVVPAGIDGKFRMIDITPQGLNFRAVEQPAAIE